MRVLIAFDKFKDSLTAPVACDTAARALRETHPDWTLDLCPLADGGKGFCEILTHSAGGTIETHAVTGPRGARTPATLGLVPLETIPAAARALLSIENPKSNGRRHRNGVRFRSRSAHEQRARSVGRQPRSAQAS